MTYRVLVCGGRDYDDDQRIHEVLSDITNPVHGGNFSFELVCGMARGADMRSRAWAKDHGLVVHEFPADWNDLSHPDAVIRTFPHNGKQYDAMAGNRRNKRMLDEGKPNLVIAFPGGKGTANMVKLAKEAGVKVIEIEAISS
jgi:hypothetical protein